MPFISNLKSLNNSTFFNVVYDDSFFMPMHKHYTYELMYVKKGSMQLCYKPQYAKAGKNSTVTLVGHQFVLINIDVPHQLIIPNGMSCNLLNIEFAPTPCNLLNPFPSLGEIVLSTEELNKCESVQQFFGEYFSVSVLDDSNNVEAVIENLHRLLNSPISSYENEYMRDLFLSQLIVSVSRCKSINSLHVTGNLYIRKATAYIEQNYQNEIHLDNIADFAGLNKAYLQRLIKSKTGKTLNDILQEYRIEKSKRLLLNSHHLIEDIGIMVGFKNRQTFTKNFIKFCGISPKKFKAQNSNKHFRHYDNYTHLYKE